MIELNPIISNYFSNYTLIYQYTQFCYPHIETKRLNGNDPDMFNA